MANHNTQKTAAVIIAAGFSSRMHAFKPLLPLGDRTVLETTVSTFTQAGISDIVVVLGHRSETIIPLIETLGIKWVINPHYEQGMFTSIQAGVKCIDSRSECFFMMPVDMPLVNPQTIRDMMAAYDDEGKDVLYPSFEGRRGHPPLMSCRLIPELIACSDSGGLKAFLEKQARPSYLVVKDSGILMDMDTEDDYKRIKQLSDSFNE